MALRKEQFRWGDADEEDEGIESVLPPPQIIGPDEKGIKVVIEWRINEQGQKLKVTRKIRVKKQLKRLKPDVIRRRQLKKFGDALGQSGSDNLTMVSTEEIFLERTNKLTGKQEEQAKTNELAALGNTSIIICRICGKKGEHWTSKCPFKEMASTRGITLGEKAPGEDDSSLPPGGKGSYVPPSMRGGAPKEGDSIRRTGREDNSVRVTNLSEDTREQDLQELFGSFGPISRIYIAFDRSTGNSRGFAFINFVNREDAVRAIKKLDGYGYDNLILHVEWAAPRS